MNPHNEVNFITNFFDKLDWYHYLIVSRWHWLILHHTLQRYNHCEESDCTFDLMYCLNCKKILGWVDKFDS